MPDRTRSRAVVPLVVALVAALVAGAAALGPALTSSAGEESATSRSDQQLRRDTGRPPLEEDPLAGLARREPDDPTALGDPDAPVVMLAYSDFQCPFCGKFARDTEPQLIEKYVDEGTLRIEWRDFPYLGPESMTAAKAGRAAGLQGEFWAFHDALYADQPAPNSGTLTQEHLVGVAEELGLDVERFRRDMNGDLVAKLVNRDFQEGQSIGVTGTPAFLVNGQPIMGAQPLATFEDAIEQAADDAR